MQTEERSASGALEELYAEMGSLQLEAVDVYREEGI